jgi:hypothetical protein
MFLFSKEYETYVSAKDGYVTFRQCYEDDTESTILLSIHQFQEIWNREESITDAARKVSE